MKLNKAYKKFLQWKLILTELPWIMIEKIPIIGQGFVQDFYPFNDEQGGATFKWYDVIIHPIQFYYRSQLIWGIKDFWKDNIVRWIEKLQTFIIGEKSYKLLMWLLHCNDSKLLESNGWSCTVRNRDVNTKYFDIQMFPFGYVIITERVYINSKTGKAENLYMRMITHMISEEEKDDSEEMNENKRIVYGGWVNNIGDILRMSRAYNKAYENTRNIWETTKEGREFSRKLKEES